MMKASERLRELAQKTPEEILAEADEIAEYEAEAEARAEKANAEPLNIEDASRHFAWSVERWLDKGADLKMVMSIISAGFAKVFAGKGYALKLKAEKLF